MNIFTSDIRNENLFFHQEHKDYLALSATNKGFRFDPRTQIRIRQIKEAIFAISYGSVAKCEANFAIETLHKRIKKQPILYSHSLLKTDEEKYLYYIGNYHAKYYKEINDLITIYSTIHKEFSAKDLLAVYSLQDLRNMCKRLQLLA